jgi:hypothetical protein
MHKGSIDVIVGEALGLLDVMYWIEKYNYISSSLKWITKQWSMQ